MIYELRVNLPPVDGLQALHDRFTKYVAGFLQKAGIGILGFWTEEIGVSNKLNIILSYESFGDKENKMNSLAADPAWQRMREETEKGGDSPLVNRVISTFMELTPYSPEPKVNSGVQELRIYDAVPGKLPALHELIANHSSGYFKKHGMSEIGYWTEMLVTNHQLICMLGYPSLADREKSWASFRADPGWQKARAEATKNGPLVANIHNTILRLTDYSPR